ncbi:MAG: hypothetical protein CXT73_06665 [Methanobacteriota archaeon]|jgi:hypothetical protein|nr:MAG: hypothetical protein CXT73_06665 [Euryarchaeota archaeon]
MVPDEIIDYITSFNSLIYVPFSKKNKEYLYKRRNKKAFLIQKWYKKYKIEKKKPILFINDLSENKIVKWYLIRIYMKFYPKEDLYDVPYYIIKKQIENESDEKKKESLKKDLFRWSIKTGTNTERRGYEVYKFLRGQTLEDIKNGGW